MKQEMTPTLPSPLESVRYQFETWRESKKNPRERIPADLWAAAASLRNQYSVSQISKALRLNHQDLKNRIDGKKPEPRKKKSLSPSFVEVDWPSCFSASECIIEMENVYGSKMRMIFKGKADLDLLGLSKAFWTKGK